MESAGAEDAGIAAGWQSGLIMEPTPIAQAMRQTAVAPARPCLCERITNSIALQKPAPPRTPPPSLCECVAKSVCARRRKRRKKWPDAFFLCIPPPTISPFQLMHVEERTCEAAGMECVFNAAGKCVRVCVCGSSNTLALWWKPGSRRKDFSLLHPFFFSEIPPVWMVSACCCIM